MDHQLKCINPYFQHVWDREKTFEIRKDDWNYKQGDILKLREWYPRSNTFSSRFIICKIIYVTDFKQADNYVVLGIRVLNTGGNQ